MAYEQANEQVNITKVAAEATRGVIQAIAAAKKRKQQRAECGAQSRWTHDEVPTFNWDMEDKYSELKTSDWRSIMYSNHIICQT